MAKVYRPVKPSPTRDKDPTRTVSLRARFLADMTRRFSELRRWIVESITVQDCFGLKESAGVKILAATQPRQFTYRTDAEKVAGFMDWLREQERLGVLEVSAGSAIGPTTSPWTDTYIRSAYQRGLAEGRVQVRQAGVDVPSFQELPGGIAGVMNQPFHADRVATLFTRVFEDLKGVTAVMDAQISRELAQAMAEGVGPYDMAKRLANRVDKIGIVRGRLIARTETVRAHNIGAMAEFEAVEQIIGEPVRVTWWTALDERVRSSHVARHGNTYSRKTALGMIGEPNCRCALLPVVAGRKKPLPGETAPEAPPKAPLNQIGELHKEGGPAFLGELNKTWDALPEKARRDFVGGGGEIRIGEKLTEIEPRLKGVRPRGWPEGTTWDMAEGFGVGKKSGTKHIGISRIREDYWRPGEWVESGRTPYVLAHEVAHGLDAFGDVTGAVEFIKAYDADVAAMLPHLKDACSYGLQPGSAGREETFACVFGELYGDPRSWDYLEGFKGVAKHIRALYEVKG